MSSTTAGHGNVLRNAYHWARAKSRRLSQDMRFLHEHKAPPALVFLREFCKKPRTVGAVWPSSRQLAEGMVRCMAERVPVGEGLIVELGAGTGQITREIARQVQDPQRLWAVEQSPKLADLLAQKMPHIHVVRGDARHLAQLVPSERPVDAIISCLPLRAFSPQDVQAITGQWAKVLAPGGTVVQFTYALWGDRVLERQGFYEADHRLIWQNFPPARIQILKKISH